MNSIDVNERIDTLDYVRGFALLGILLVNIIPLAGVALPAPGSPDALYQNFLYLFVEGRFFTIFSFLFGVGFYLFITRAAKKGRNGYGLFLRRILALFVFGWIHVKFHPGEALTVYAVCGLIILPFYKANKLFNLVAGLFLLIGTSLLSAKILMPLPLMLLGIAAGQYRVFEEVSSKKVGIFTVVMFVLSAGCLFYQSLYIPSVPFDLFTAGGVDEANFIETYRFVSIGLMIGPVLSAFYVGLLMLLLQLPTAQKILSPLKSYGRMALTNYVSQTIFIYAAGNLFTPITYVKSLFICIAIYIIQFIFTVIWLRYFRFGPLEWIWRMATYFEKPPMQR